MVKRKYWLKKIEEAWQKRSVVWLSGVRRAGKTFLSQSLSRVEYFDCELPRVRRMMEDPEGFLKNLRGKRVVLDEIHRLGDPAELLKIAADHYPDIHVLATGSSTLGASARFKDTLTGRKAEIWLTPMIYSDLYDFEKTDLHYRLLRGGLPPFFLSDKLPERDFQEWIDAYWSKDIQELFRLERRYSFQRFLELLFVQSGGIFEATRFAKACEASRGTISNYLKVLEATLVINVIRPFSTHRPTEIVAAPKVYAFDSGFVCYFRGWQELHPQEVGILWEHFVLNEIFANLQSRHINYWRDKQQHEVDFIIVQRGKSPVALECKWSAVDFEPKNVQAFRRNYPDGKNLVVANDVDRPFERQYGHISVKFVSLPRLIKVLLEKFKVPSV